MSTARQTDSESPNAAILAAIRGQIEPVRTSPMYVAGMALVALVMVLLPVVYLALILAVAWLLWYHATHSIVIFEHARGRSAKGAFGIYVAPLVIGGIVLLFMVKPLFAPRSREQEPEPLDPADEPFLFAFVNRLCEAVHAPAPREIRVDTEVNASAALRRGFWSMFGSDLTLTIGLPLAAGMSLRQLSGVLAHEFGHFSQGAGMRLTYIIRAISFWFVRVVYERDSWDEWLNERLRTADGGVNLLFQLARASVWLTRRVLWVLMWIGHLVSCFMLRQMEFDADRHEARFAGSDSFQQTARRLAELSVARQMALDDLGRFLDEGRLADDLPALVLAKVPRITPEIRRDVLDPMESSKTGLFDTHPADRDRVASARLEKTQGIFRLPARFEGATHPDSQDRNAAARDAGVAEPAHFGGSDEGLPASVLFRDFRQLARRATLEFYEQQLERKIRAEELHPVESLVGSLEADAQAARSLEGYFLGTCNPLRPLAFAADPVFLPVDVQEPGAALAKARERMQAQIEPYRVAFKEFDEADTEHLAACVAEAVHGAGAGTRRREVELKFDSTASAAAAAEKARATMESAGLKLADFETAAAERLLSALQLAHLPEPRAAAKLDEAAAERIAGLLGSTRLTVSLLPELVQLRNQLAAFSSLLGCIQENEKSAALIAAIRSSAAAVRERLVSLRARLAGNPYPFEHTQADMTLDRYVFGFPAETDFPAPDEISSIGQLANDALNKLFMLYHRLLAQLAVVAEKLEAALGLPPLVAPAPVPAAEATAGSA